MEIKKEAIDIHYDIVRMTASKGCKFVTKTKREDIIDYVTFYRDPNVLGCCYTKSIIAPKYLTDKDYEIYEPI